MRFEIERSATEKLIIEKTEFKGRELITLRIYFLSKDEEWLPTKKGVTVKVEQIGELMDALNSIKASL